MTNLTGLHTNCFTCKADNTFNHWFKRRRSKYLPFGLGQRNQLQAVCKQQLIRILPGFFEAIQNPGYRKDIVAVIVKPGCRPLAFQLLLFLFGKMRKDIQIALRQPKQILIQTVKAQLSILQMIPLAPPASGTASRRRLPSCSPAPGRPGRWRPPAPQRSPPPPLR